MKYVKLQAVLNHITLDESEFNDLDQLLVNALTALNICPILENVSTNVEVLNHLGDLPEDLVRLRYVALHNGDNSDIENNICDDCTEDGSTVDCRNCASVVTTSSVYPVNLAEQYACRIRRYGITYIFDYYSWTQSIDYKNNYELMTPRKTPFTNQIRCKNCADPMLSTCSETYDILPSNQIRTSTEDCDVCIDYLRFAADEDGDFLIPDDEKLHRCLASYVMWKHWESRANRLEQGAMKMMIYFRRQYSGLKQSYRGDVVMRAYDPVAVNQIMYRDIKRARSAGTFNNQYQFSSVNNYG